MWSSVGWLQSRAAAVVVRDRVASEPDLVMGLGTVLALGLAAWRSWEGLLSAGDLVVFGVLYLLTGLGVTVRAVCQQRDAAHYSALTGIEPLLAPTAIERRPVRLAWEQTGLPRAVARAAPDLLHCPHYTMPARRPVPTVVTLHDATFFTDPDLHTRTIDSHVANLRQKVESVPSHPIFIHTVHRIGYRFTG